MVLWALERLHGVQRRLATVSCAECNVKRAKTLIAAREAMEEFDLDELMGELNYRWPHQFYLVTDVEAKVHHLKHKNTVPPHEPYHVHTVSYEHV